MPGFALLPTMEAPVSRMTLRLSNEDMKERNEWIVGANERGMAISEIAYEVGLSEPRVRQIIKKASVLNATVKTKKFKTPRDAALAEFMADGNHLMSGGCKAFDWECHNCCSSYMMIESEYDADGWPLPWAMYGQEKYIEMCS